MKSVFVKEWRQGRLIPLSGLLLGGLIVVLLVILSVTYARDRRDQQALYSFCGIVFCCIFPVLAVHVGSGLIAAEVERGTLPALLSLPLSRRQIWLGKLLAGISLYLAAALLLLISGAVGLQPALDAVNFWLVVPELILGSLILFVISFFWSTACGAILGAALATLVLWMLLVIGAWSAIGILGARLLGTGLLLDVELWMLAVSPALLVGSYVGFLRGELLQSRRRWVLPCATAAAATLVICLVLIGTVRWETRYARAQVERIGWEPTLTGGGSAVSFFTYASEVQHRKFEARWFQLGESQYRSKHAVCVDLKSGNEILIRRESNPPVVSPEGRLAAVLCGPRPLTWFDEHIGFPIRTVEVWDLQQHRLVYRGLPEEFKRGELPELEGAEWSPDGSWLALTTSAPLRWRRGTYRLMFMRADGSEAHDAKTEALRNYWGSWDWDPSGQAVYLLRDDGRLARYSLTDRKSETIWESSSTDELPARSAVYHGALAVSPDGRQLAVALYGHPSRAAAALPPAEDRFFLFIISADGSGSQLVFESPDVPVFDEEGVRLIWSQGADTLYVVRAAALRGQRRNEWHGEILVWRRGQPEAVRVGSLPDAWSSYDLLLSERLLIYNRRRLWSVGADGELRSVPDAVARSLAGGKLLGVDDQGRAILREWDEDGHIAAVDLTTGALTRIYP